MHYAPKFKICILYFVCPKAAVTERENINVGNQKSDGKYSGFQIYYETVKCLLPIFTDN